MLLQASETPLGINKEKWQDPNLKRTTCPRCGGSGSLQKYKSMIPGKGTFHILACICLNPKRVGRGKEKLCGRKTVLEKTRLEHDLMDLQTGTATDNTKKEAETVGKTVLTKEQTENLKKDILSGEYNMKQIAQKHKVNYCVVTRYRKKLQSELCMDTQPVVWQPESQTPASPETSPPAPTQKTGEPQETPEHSEPKKNTLITHNQSYDVMEIERQAEKMFTKAYVSAYERGFIDGRRSVIENLKKTLGNFEAA
jgi:hypothetical protein